MICELSDWQRNTLNKVIESLGDELKSGDYTVLSTDKSQNEMGLSMEIQGKIITCSIKLSVQ